MKSFVICLLSHRFMHVFIRICSFSSLLFSSVPWYGYINIICLFTRWWTFGLCPVFGYYKENVMNIDIQVFESLLSILPGMSLEWNCWAPMAILWIYSFEKFLNAGSFSFSLKKWHFIRLRIQTEPKGIQGKEVSLPLWRQRLSSGIISGPQGLRVSCASIHAFSTHVQIHPPLPLLRKWEQRWSPPCSLLAFWVRLHPRVVCTWDECTPKRWRCRVAAAESVSSPNPPFICFLVWAWCHSACAQPCLALRSALGACSSRLGKSNQAVECQDPRSTIFINVTKHTVLCLAYFVADGPLSKWGRWCIVRKAAFSQESQGVYPNIYQLVNSLRAGLCFIQVCDLHISWIIPWNITGDQHVSAVWLKWVFLWIQRT